MSKLEENKQKKQRLLLDTAFHLFITKGLNRTTISDIVSQAGVAKGTFYLYFADKHDILDHLVASKTRDLFLEGGALLKETNLSTESDQIHFLVDFILDRLCVQKSLLAFLSQNLSWGILKGLYQDCAGESGRPEVLDLFFNGHLGRTEAQLLFYTIVELVLASCTGCILYEQPLPLDEYRPFLHRCIDGILTQFPLA